MLPLVESSSSPSPSISPTPRSSRKRQMTDDLNSQAPGTAKKRNVSSQQQKLEPLISRINAVSQTDLVNELEIHTDSQMPQPNNPLNPDNSLIASGFKEEENLEDIYEAYEIPSPTSSNSNSLPRTPQPTRRVDRTDSQARAQGDSNDQAIHTSNGNLRSGSQVTPAKVIAFEAGREASDDQVENRLVKHYSGVAMPAYVTELAPYIIPFLLANPNVKFSKKFLQTTLQGALLGNGWFLASRKKQNIQKRPFPKCTSYMLMSRDTDPLLPRQPGAHGAQISAFLFSIEDEIAHDLEVDHIPLFIGDSDGSYRYYGTYHEPRYSDRLGANEIKALPEYVKQNFAKVLGSTRKSRASIETIRAAWPQEVVGWVDEQTGELIKYEEDLESDLGEPLKKMISTLEAEKVTVDEVRKALDAPDTGTESALRLFWEYLECDGYDLEFYNKLVELKAAEDGSG